jgi:hypothetical protein
MVEQADQLGEFQLAFDFSGQVTVSRHTTCAGLLAGHPLLTC